MSGEGNQELKKTFPGFHVPNSLQKAALISWGFPAASLSFGIISGAHNFRVRKKVVYLSNLPKSFDGITIGQISDIHAGSLFNKTAIRGGVDLLMQEKPDVIFLPAIW